MTPLEVRLPAPVSGRLAVLDELKGVAILLVVIYHAGGVLVWRNFFHGDLGVDMFVILSGIGLAFGSRFDGTVPFLKKRLIRIMPTYWIVLTAYWALNAYFLQDRYSAGNLITHYLGIHAWFGDVYGMAINDSFWFITLILSLYVIYCGLQRWTRTLEQMLLGGALLSTAIAFAYFFPGQAGIFGHLALRLPGFFLGLLIGRLMKEGRLTLHLGPLLVVALFILTYVPYTQGIMFFSPLVGLALMGAYVLAWKPGVRGNFGGTCAKRLKFLGDHSLEIFLIHQPLIRNYNYYAQGRWLGANPPSPLALIVGMIIGFAITLVLAVELRRLMQRMPWARPSPLTS